MGVPAETRARQARALKIAGQTLAVVQAVVFAPDGHTGVWDILEQHYGVRNISEPRNMQWTPDGNSVPWVLQLTNGVCTQVFPDGAIKITSMVSSVAAIN